jgi:hypothetical protein
MKVLLVHNFFHPKNLNAFKNYNITIHAVHISNFDKVFLNDYDVVFSPSDPIDVRKYPDTKFIFGPHFSVFPEERQMKMIEGKNTVYIQPSEWAKNVWENYSYCKKITIKSLPFGVDTNRFHEIRPITDRNTVFIYFKRRMPSELNTVYNFLLSKGYNPVVFDYVKKYSEDSYLNCLQNSKFGFWLDAHESQGFALQEALSCNVPLLVWNVSFLNQEYGSSYPKVFATSIPYWSESCGECFTDITEIDQKFNHLIKNLPAYKPRDFILENLSIEKCSSKFIDLVNGIVYMQEKK